MLVNIKLMGFTRTLRLKFAKKKKKTHDWIWHAETHHTQEKDS